MNNVISLVHRTRFSLVCVPTLFYAMRSWIPDCVFRFMHKCYVYFRYVIKLVEDVKIDICAVTHAEND